MGDRDRPTTVEELARAIADALRRQGAAVVDLNEPPDDDGALVAALRAAGLTDAMLIGWRPAEDPPEGGEEVIVSSYGEVDKAPHIYRDGAWWYWDDGEGWFPTDADEEPFYWHPYPDPPDPIKSVPWGAEEEDDG